MRRRRVQLLGEGRTRNPTLNPRPFNEASYPSARNPNPEFGVEVKGF